MKFSRRPRRSLAQTTSEYMIMISVVAVGAMAAIAIFSQPGSPVQTSSEQLIQSFETGLDNTRGMKVQ